MSKREVPPRRSGVTLKQIADTVGVSVSTVSRVLSFDATLSVTDQTRQAIVETAGTLSYETPRMRRYKELTSYSGKIALLHFLRPEEELADPYYVSLRLGIESRCAALGLEYQKLYHADRLPDADILSEFAGIIAIGWHSHDEVQRIISLNRNVVFADFQPGGDSIDSVESDLAAATRKLLNALFELGYRRIAFAGWYDRTSLRNIRKPELRCTTYENWMKERDLFDPALYVIGSNTEESGHALATQLLRRPDRPEVIMAANDNMAVGVYRVVHELGLGIPEDIAVVSFNDISAARFLTPPLTTVRLPAERIGENAVELIAERIAGRDLAKRIILESRIAWRDSCRKPDSTSEVNFY
jgi:LacI family transcriptional regulator, galactose operon repressor